MTNEIWSRGQTNALTISDTVLYSRLTETVAWCAHVSGDTNIRASMRSPELSPRILHDGRDDVVCGVGSTRQRRIRATPREPVSSCPDLLNGRLLIYFPDADLSDGAAEAVSDGFFDVCNIPPWDTWVAYFEDNPGTAGSYDNYLLSYVPKQLVTIAGSGILVNPEQCIMWLSDAEVKLKTRFPTIR